MEEENGDAEMGKSCCRTADDIDEDAAIVRSSTEKFSNHPPKNSSTTPMTTPSVSTDGTSKHLDCRLERASCPTEPRVGDVPLGLLLVD